MSKNIDWNRYAKPAVTRRAQGKYSSLKEAIDRSNVQKAAQDNQADLFKSIEPKLKEKLFKAMISKQPIELYLPITNWTETLQKSSSGLGNYSIAPTQIPAGTKLIFKGTNTTLGQWTFEDEKGELIEIYNSPVIRTDASNTVQNPAYYGLMTNTNIYSEVKKELEEN